jgi:hypothetical protein
VNGEERKAEDQTVKNISKKGGRREAIKQP